MIRAAVVLLAMAMPAAADPVASFRIEAELAAVGQAPAIEAMPGDIAALNQHAGPALEVTLHPRFDAAVADLTAVSTILEKPFETQSLGRWRVEKTSDGITAPTRVRT